MSKVVATLQEAIRLCGLEDGMSVSFHHCFRGGDLLGVQIAEAIRSLGIRNITIVPSSLGTGHDTMIPYLENGTITSIRSSGLSPALGKVVQRSILRDPCEFRTHGGRPAALKDGSLQIDVAIVAAAVSDRQGNCNGTGSESAFGSMGYSMVDVRYAKKVIVVTDHLSNSPVFPVSIEQSAVDYVVALDAIGDPAGISTGSMKPSSSPLNMRIANLTAQVITASGYLREGVKMQTGAGKISLIVATQIAEEMERQQISGDFAMGGITAMLAGMYEKGLLKVLYDTQTFDTTAIASLARNPGHVEVSAETYACPTAKGGPIVNQLDFVILGATEIDTDFNVNVITDSNNRIVSGAGGHGDTAEGAKMTIITAPLYRNKYPTIVNRVNVICTPGRFVDVFVCQDGVAVNTSVPRNAELAQRLRDAGLPVKNIHDLQRRAEQFTGKLPPLKKNDRIIGKMIWRDGSVLDWIYAQPED